MYTAKASTGGVSGRSKVALAAVGSLLVAVTGFSLVPDAAVPVPTARPAISPAPAAQLPRRRTPDPIVAVAEPDRLEVGRNALIIDGVRFSVDVPHGWESFGADRPNYISKSETGPQGAEAVIFWSAYPGGGSSAICSNLRHIGADASPADVAEAAASVPGTVPIIGPTSVILGGRASRHIAFTVRRDVGCDPGFFFTYANTYGGAMWPETVPGDTIRVWIVDQDETVFWIQGTSHSDATDNLIQEMEQTIDSIRFD
jgi:hypothetical protein